MNKINLDSINPGKTELKFTYSGMENFDLGSLYLIVEKNELVVVFLDNNRHTYHFENDVVHKYFELPKQETKPVYNQSMYDNGEPLLEGMLFNGVDDKKKPRECKCLAIAGESNNLCVLYSHNEGESIGSCWLNSAWIRPIEIRSNQEITEDELAIFFKKQEAWTHTSLFEAINNGQFTFLMFTGAK